MISRSTRLRSRWRVWGVVPDLGKLPRQSHDLLFGGFSKGFLITLTLLFILPLSLRQFLQPTVPFGLQHVRYQAVIGIHLQVTALGQIGLVAGPLHLHSEVEVVPIKGL